MDRIQTQAALLWQRLSAPDTGATYKQAALLTGDILKEAAALVWLLICLVLVAVEWFWKTSVQLGRDLRDWLTGLDQSSPDRVVSEAGRALLLAGRNSIGFTLFHAKEQLGISHTAEPVRSALPAKTSSINTPEPYRAFAAPPSTSSPETSTTPASTQFDHPESSDDLE